MEKSTTAERSLSHRRIQALDRASRDLELSGEGEETDPYRVPELDEWLKNLRRDEGDGQIE